MIGVSTLPFYLLLWADLVNPSPGSHTAFPIAFSRQFCNKILEMFMNIPQLGALVLSLLEALVSRYLIFLCLY